MDNFTEKTTLSKIIENKKTCIIMGIISIIFTLGYGIGFPYIIGRTPLNITLSMLGSAYYRNELRFPSFFAVFGFLTIFALLLNVNYAYHKHNFIKTIWGKLGFIATLLASFFMLLTVLIPSIYQRDIQRLLGWFQIVGHLTGAIAFSILSALATVFYFFGHIKVYKGFGVLSIILTIGLVVLGIFAMFTKDNGLLEMLPLVIITLLWVLVNAGVFPKKQLEEQLN